MANSPEVEKIWMHDTAAEPHVVTIEDLHENAVNLSAFLSEGPISEIGVRTVIPSVKFGFMFRAVLTRVREIDNEGNEAYDIYETNSTSLRLLELRMNRMSEAERIKHSGIIDNLTFIRFIVNNPFNWSEPFNIRKDH